MKIMKNETETVTKISAVFCNMCGEQIETGHSGYLDTYISIEKKWGYGSDYDNEEHSFDFCDKCYKALVAQFKIPPMGLLRTCIKE